MRWLKTTATLVIVLAVVYLLGPHPAKPVYGSNLPAVPGSVPLLSAYVNQIESLHKLKPDNNARIIWANDSTKQKTEYAIVYLHGFSASQEEANPVHRNIAKQFGCNLYLSRLADHGIDTVDAMINLTPDALWESAKQAYAIGKQLGNKVILMGTSTGASLALQLAATYPDVAGLILLSPNIEINDSRAWILNNPWGLQIARLVKHSDFNIAEHDEVEYKKYWYYKYRLEATVALQEYLKTTMLPATFAKVHQPTLVLYYYKDEAHQDKVVRVDAMKKMFDELGTRFYQKKIVALSTTGNHVLACPIVSKDVVAPQKEIASFLDDVMDVQ
jgi:esterase/lipase